MSNPNVEEVIWYQVTLTKGMVKCIRRMIGGTSVSERVDEYGISKEDSRRLSAFYRKLGVVDET